MAHSIRHWADYLATESRESRSWAITDRGWYTQHGMETSLGFYLDYGKGHYRSPHEYCSDACVCRDSQPGNILAVVVNPRMCRWVETAHDAKDYIEANTKEVAGE